MKGLLTWLLRLAAAAFALSMLGTLIASVFVRARLVRQDDPGADEIALIAIMQPLEFRSTASGLRGGTIDCWYGGGVVDLRDATLDPAGARLRVRAVYGGGQILVPEDWNVTLRVLPLMGGVGDARPQVAREAEAPQLTIDGIAFFGGFGVVSAMPAGQAGWAGRVG